MLLFDVTKKVRKSRVVPLMAMSLDISLLSSMVGIGSSGAILSLIRE